MITMGIDCASKISGIAIVSNRRLLHSEQYKTLLPPKACDDELANAFLRYKKHLIIINKKFKPDKWVVEFTGMTRNATTFRLLCYFEAMTLLAAAEAKVPIEQVRVITARKEVLKSGNISKEFAYEAVKKKYKKITNDDEADAIVYALYGNQQVL